MRDLAYGPQKRAWHNMRTIRVKILYLLSRLRRLLNKQLGLPANRQTAILAEMLSQLRTASESSSEHNSHVSRAVLSSIDAAILSTEEISDVFDYLQMKNHGSARRPLPNL